MPSLTANSSSASLGRLPSIEEWDELAERVGASPFDHPGWINSWARSFSEKGLCAVTVRRGDELVAVMPLEQHRSMLRAPINGHTPVFGPLAADDEALAALLKTLFADRSASVELEPLDREAPEFPQIVVEAERNGRVVLQREIAQAPYIDLEGTFEDYEASLSRNRRKAIRRHRRRLEELGEVRFEVHDGSERLDELLGEVFAVEASGWKGEAGTAIASSQETKAFYTDVARWAVDRGWLRLAFLRLDGRAIACDYGLKHDGTWYSLKAGYEDEFRSYGPGAILLRDEIAYCYEHGLRRFHLLGTGDEFKSSWTDRDEPRTWMRALRRDPVGLSMWAGLSMREAVRPLARRVKYAISDANTLSIGPALAQVPLWA